MNEIRECPRCHMPTLPDQEHLKHYLWCPDHDPATCFACRDEATEGAHEAPGAPRNPVQVVSTALGVPRASIPALQEMRLILEVGFLVTLWPPNTNHPRRCEKRGIADILAGISIAGLGVERV